MKVNIKWNSEEGKMESSVVIHKTDCWSLDYTLALIIYPALKQLKKMQHGSPFVDDEDVPEELRAPEEALNNWDIDDKFHDRWAWVLDEMIWAFKQKVKGRSGLDFGVYDTAGRDFDNRMTNAFRLFGKYYQGLWD